MVGEDTAAALKAQQAFQASRAVALDYPTFYDVRVDACEMFVVGNHLTNVLLSTFQYR